jgi:hypothetical protein
MLREFVCFAVKPWRHKMLRETWNPQQWAQQWASTMVFLAWLLAVLGSKPAILYWSNSANQNWGFHRLFSWIWIFDDISISIISASNSLITKLLPGDDPLLPGSQAFGSRCGRGNQASPCFCWRDVFTLEIHRNPGFLKKCWHYFVSFWFQDRVMKFGNYHLCEIGIGVRAGRSTWTEPLWGQLNRFMVKFRLQKLWIQWLIDLGV